MTEEAPTRIIDTNVLATANGHHDAAPPDCVAECAAKLYSLMQNGHVVLDDGWRFLTQYVKNIDGPGAGEAFLQWLFQNNADPLRCTQVPITPSVHDDSDFDEVPSPLSLPKGERIDPADRMFLAVAAAHPEHPLILQATDSKWIGWETALRAHDIEIEWVCREYAQTIYDQKVHGKPKATTSTKTKEKKKGRAGRVPRR